MNPATQATPESIGSVTQLAAWTDFGCSLLEAVAAHSFRWKQEENDRFRKGLSEVLEGLKRQPTSSAVLIAAGTAAQKVEEYYRDTQAVVEGSVAELDDIIRLLMSALSAVQMESASCASALREIEETIGKANTAEDLRVVKVQLATALRGLSEKQTEQKQQAAELVGKLEERVSSLEQSARSDNTGIQGQGTAERLQPRVADQADVHADVHGMHEVEEALDLLTGLPNKIAAGNALAALEPHASGTYMAAFYVQRMAHFNARLGDKVGNQLLFLCAQRIANALLSADDQLFRWRGPAFVAILRREDDLIEVKKEIKRVLASRFQFELRGGAMLVTPSVAAEAFPMGPGRGVDRVEELEKFFSLRSTCGV